jgi:membrane protease YdiL (CAAX protease family)
MRFSKKSLGLAVILGSAAILLAWGLATSFGASWAFNSQSRFGGLGPVMEYLIVAGSLPTKIAILAAGEELFFRGIMLQTQGLKSNRLGRQLWFHGLLFGIWHIPLNWAVMHMDAANMAVNVALQCCHGVLFAALFLLGSRAIFPAAVAHGLIDWLLQDLVAKRGLLLLNLKQGAVPFLLGILAGTLAVAIISTLLVMKKKRHLLKCSESAILSEINGQPT